MAAKKTIAPQEVLQADGIFTMWERLQAYVLENYRQIAAIGLILCVIVAGILFWRARQGRAEQESLTIFYEALAILDKQPTEAAGRDQQYGQALEKFVKAISSHPGTHAAKAALFYAGNCSFSLKKYDEAIAHFQDFLAQADKQLAFLQPFAYEGIGYAHEAKGDYPKALEWYERQRNAQPAGVNAFALLNLARCHEAASEQDKACQRYKEFLEQNPASSFKELAQSKVASLCSQKQGQAAQ